MNFGDVFSKAWKTIWNNKILWVFGLMAGFLSANNGGGNPGSGIRYEYSGNWQNLPFGLHQWGTNLEQYMDRFAAPNVAIILALVCLGILFALLFTFLGIVGQGALVKGVWQYDEDNTRKLRFGPLFKEGLKYFWKLFALGLLLFAAGIGVAIVVVILAVVTLGIGAVIFACLAIPLAIGVAILLKQTVISIVAEDMDIFAAIEHAWDFVFQKNLGNYLLMWLIVGVGGAVVNFLVALPFAAMALPMLGSLAFGGDTAIGGGMLVGFILGLAYLPIYLVLAGGLRAFTDSVWAIFYRELRFAHDEASLTSAELEASIPASGDEA
ncbi:MAG: hypothetical protein HPY85_09790 [Anaerolineae bacterium]|nr:hypothetical protein [Anaerolineae bacterium]